jgi:TetR/AcrR family transcriptional repressor of mexJK operon
MDGRFSVMYITVNDESDLQRISVTSAPPPPIVDRRREGRRLAIIDAAETLFLERGYERTSLSAIIDLSGGSLATVYELFGNKQGLLRAVIEREHGPDLCRMSDDGGEAPRKLLTDYAHRLYEEMMTPRTIALMRVIIVESMRDPNFSSEFHRNVHMPIVREVADIFERWTREGRANIDRPEAAAELFLATIISDAQLRAMTAIPPPPLIEAGLDWRLAPFFSHFGFL